MTQKQESSKINDIQISIASFFFKVYTLGSVFASVILRRAKKAASIDIGKQRNWEKGGGSRKGERVIVIESCQ